MSAKFKFFTQAEFRLFSLMKEYTAIIYTLTEYEFLILGSKHPTVLYRNYRFHHRIYGFQLILLKFPNLHIVRTAGKNLALPDTLSRNTPPELITQKTTVEISQNIKLFLAKDKTSPRIECKNALDTDSDASQTNTLEHFPL